jgi:hypothetical protein
VIQFNRSDKRASLFNVDVVPRPFGQPDLALIAQPANEVEANWNAIQLLSVVHDWMAAYEDQVQRAETAERQRDQVNTLLHEMTNSKWEVHRKLLRCEEGLK